VQTLRGNDAIKTYLHKIDCEGGTIFSGVGWVSVGVFGEVGNCLCGFMEVFDQLTNCWLLNKGCALFNTCFLSVTLGLIIMCNYKAR
jgi:hypothetical protein